MNILKVTLLSSLSVLLTACAASSTKNTESYYGKNGKQNRVVTCSMYKPANCKRKAGNICKSKGYKYISAEKPAFSSTKRYTFQCK